MANRRRYHSISLKLTDEELQLWNTKHEASGLSKTDYLMQALRNSKVRIYTVEDSIAPIIHANYRVVLTGTLLQEDKPNGVSTNPPTYVSDIDSISSDYIVYTNARIRTDYVKN